MEIEPTRKELRNQVGDAQQRIRHLEDELGETVDELATERQAHAMANSDAQAMREALREVADGLEQIERDIARIVTAARRAT